MLKEIRKLNQAVSDIENASFDADSNNLADIKQSIDKLSKKVNRLYVFLKIIELVGAGVGLAIILFLTYSLVRITRYIHLYGFGTQQFKYFDWNSLLSNLFQTTFFSILISYIIFLAIDVINTLFKNETLNKFITNIGKLIVLTLLIGSPVFSLSISMNSDQLAITTSAIALFAVFSFMFKKPLSDFSESFRRLSNRLYNNKMKNK